MPDGLKRKYNITKADGRPVSGRYFVLKVDSKDPAHANACRRGVAAYAAAVGAALPELGRDLLGALVEHAQTGSWDKWDQCVGDA